MQPAGEKALPDGQRKGLISEIKRKQKHLRPWVNRHRIECYRVFDCEAADLPLQIDLYGNHLHVCEIERPNEGSAAHGPAWLLNAAETAAATLGIRFDRVFTKLRPKHARAEQHGKRSDRSYCITVTESGLRFEVNLSDYLDTGLFLDHRITRGMVADMSDGARVLNLFSYTGAFSVYAAAGGAISTTSVDLSARYLEWAKRNMRANGFLDIGFHRFERMCAFDFLSRASDRGERWDIIILDPPTFSNSRNMSRTMDIRRDHPELIERCYDLLSKEGVLVFSTNAREFYLNQRYLKHLKPKNLTNETIPEDFARSRPHRTWLFTAT